MIVVPIPVPSASHTTALFLVFQDLTVAAVGNVVAISSVRSTKFRGVTNTAGLDDDGPKLSVVPTTDNPKFSACANAANKFALGCRA